MLNNPDFSKKVTAALGPTNTGKTHYAIERMLCHPNGMIGLPLRLLAREVYEKVAARSGKQTVALITGEERVVPADPKYWICTVEAMPVKMDLEFLAVDEIQMCSDLERGHVFTERLLKARGLKETVFLGSNAIRAVLEGVLPNVEFIRKKRLSKLNYVDSRKLNRVPPRSAIVCFSVDEVYAIAELIRREKGGAAIVTGGLSPKTRNSQVQVYQNGDVDYLVATDAIGMGLNLDITNVAFASLSKFDGVCHRNLFSNELAQIAGRAGRYMSDGTFGVTAGCPSLKLATIHKIENHIFSSIKKLQWRNSDLSFETLQSLIGSLEEKSSQQYLVKARENIDQRALRAMAESSLIADRILSSQDVQLLWKICQIPDYRKISLSDHVQTLREIFLLLWDRGQLPEEWLEKKIVTLDKYDGGIDGLSKRLAYIRTWNYVANRGNWLENPQTLQEKSKLIEDKLSDYLHQLLIERFVDRRTTVLMRRIREKVKLTADLNNKGELFVEDQLIGKLQGLTFVLDSSGSPHENKTLLSVAKTVIKSKILILIEQLYDSPDGDFSLDNEGNISWRGDLVGGLKSGKSMLDPGFEPVLDSSVGVIGREKLLRRVKYFLERLIKENMAPLLSLIEDKEICGPPAGLVFRLGESLGVLPREEVSVEVKSIDQETRSKFRKHGVRFGQYSIFQTSLLKPEPTRIRIVLWKTFHKASLVPEPPIPGLVTIPVVEEVNPLFYPMAGFRLLGRRAVRIDMLERLADLIRVKNSKKGFEATTEMLSITGLTLLQFRDLMEALGFKAVSMKRKVSSELNSDGQVVVRGEHASNSTNERNKARTDFTNNRKDLNDHEEEYFLFSFKSKRERIRKTSQNIVSGGSKNNCVNKVKKESAFNKKSKHVSSKPRSSIKVADPDSPFAALASLIKN